MLSNEDLTRIEETLAAGTPTSAEDVGELLSEVREARTGLPQLRADVERKKEELVEMEADWARERAKRDLAWHREVERVRAEVRGLNPAQITSVTATLGHAQSAPAPAEAETPPEG